MRREKLLLVMSKNGIISNSNEVHVMRDMKNVGVSGNKRAWESVYRFILTILASAAVMQALIEMIPQGGWLTLSNYTAGIIVLTVLAHEKAKRSK